MLVVERNEQKLGLQGKVVYYNLINVILGLVAICALLLT